MRVYLLDTNITSALWDKRDRYHAEALRFIQSVGSADRVYISRIVIAEIDYGNYLYINADAERRKMVQAAMQAFEHIREVDNYTAHTYSVMRAALFRRYGTRTSKNRIKKVRPECLVDKTTSLELGIQENDLWMAAIAVQYNMIFVTDDYMSRIKDVWPSLKLLRWRPPLFKEDTKKRRNQVSAQMQ